MKGTRRIVVSIRYIRAAVLAVGSLYPLAAFGVVSSSDDVSIGNDLSVEGVSVSNQRVSSGAETVTTDGEFRDLINELEQEELAAVASNSSDQRFNDIGSKRNRGDVVPSQRTKQGPFTVDGIVARQVKFWELIFHTYPSTSILIHDVDEPDRIIDLIDFKDSAKGNASHPVRGRSYRQRVAKRYVDRYEIALRRFAKVGESALQYGAIERRIWSTYAEDDSGRKKLLSGQVSIRSQSGLADEFARAAVSAQKYLPYMEKVFRDAGLPVELTRLPFVESMFNVKARSKVGASGIWQFMPQTARLYMKVDGRVVDERNSPWKATRAAAQLMADNYQALRSWPLAITAYNHGTAGMERATREVGTSDLGAIIERHSSPTFGFASRNFYAEFIAAVNTYEKLSKSSQLRNKRNASESISFTTLPKRASVAEVIRHSKVSKAKLSELNPCLLPGAFKRYQHRKLPAGYRLRLPPNNAKKLQYAMKSKRKSKTTISRR